MAGGVGWRSNQASLDQRNEFVGRFTCVAVESGNGSTAVGHDDFDSFLDLIEVAAEVVLEVANPDFDPRRCGYLDEGECSYLPR